VKGALVIGAGPAGLMAAEEIAKAGHPVVVAEAMPTPARKFLMAGKSGLNLTKDEPPADFVRNLSLGTGGRLPPDPRGYFGQSESGFGPAEVMDWARGLGVDLFTGSTGRVFPVGMKASPLLRAWLARLAGMGVDLRSRWRWQCRQDRRTGGWAEGGARRALDPRTRCRSVRRGHASSQW